MKNKNAYNEGFDLVKSIMALFVIAIHTLLLSSSTKIGLMLLPLVRTAVPVFFLFSGYFFFKKMDKIPATEQLPFLKRNIIRYLQLYVIWFVITFPVTVEVRKYFQHGLTQGILTIISNFFLGSTFIASWYIMGLIIGIPIIYLLSKFINKWLLCTITLALNVYCVLLTNYGQTVVGKLLWSWTQNHFFGYSPYLSFIVGLLWLMIGKLFADGDLKALVNKRSKYFVGLFLVLLYFEEYGTYKAASSLYTDCFFMLIPLCTFFFGWILSTHWSVPGSRHLRAFSTIAYCFHASFAVVLKYLLMTAGIPVQRFRESLLVWFVTVFVSWLLTLLILRLEKFPFFKWLRLSH